MLVYIPNFHFKLIFKMPRSQSRSNLFNVFKKSAQLSKLYNIGLLDDVIAQFRSLMNPQFYLGGHKCSAFLLPDHNLVFKVSLKNIRYFKNGYCGKFRDLCGKRQPPPPQDPILFFQYHINSMPSCYAPIKDIVYEDENIFVYTQDVCIPLRKYQTIKGLTVFNPIIVAKILQLIIYLFVQNNLVTEIGTYNIGIIELHNVSSLVLFDYETIRPLFETLINRPMTWWGSLVGNLLHYLSHVFCPNRQKLYHKKRKYWRKHPDDIASIKNDFPFYVVDLIYSIIHPIDDVNQQMNTIIKNLKYCRKQIISMISKPDHAF